MFSDQPSTLTMHAANAAGALLVGLFFAFVGLNAASGCGQGGQCIKVKDLVFTAPAQQLAERTPGRAG